MVFSGRAAHTTTPPMTEVLRQLGRYELLRRIAVGGMGEIFLARMRGAGGFQKRVIIKTILAHLAEEPEFIARFLDEGRIVVQLTHGNIVPVFDMGEHEGEYFIAMEYIPGRDLREVLKRLQVEGQIMPLDLAALILSEVCKGLSYAHRKRDEDGQELGIVHRDVSPSNILVSHEGEVKVIDFGIARASSRLGQTVSGRIQGKFCYMSPEQAAGQPVDERSDIFSAGVVLYEMITGMRPFQGDSDLESLDLVRRCELDPPSTLNPTIPEPVEQIVMRALARERHQRYDTIDQLQAELLHYLYTHGQPPRAQDVASFLQNLFPEGVERRELRSGGSGGSSGSGSSPRSPALREPLGRPVSLDDALGMELERMLGQEPSSAPGQVQADAVTATAAEGLLTPRAKPPLAQHTATLAPSKTPAAADTPAASDAPAADTSHADADLPSGDLGELGLDTLGLDARGLDDAASGEAARVESKLDEAEEADEADEAPARSAPEAKPDAKPEAKPDAKPEVAPPELAASASWSGPELDLWRMRGVKRSTAAAALALMLAISGGIVGANAWQERKIGEVQLQSEPADAEIYLNGAKLPGQLTPTTLKLKEGSYTLQLRKRDHSPTEPLSVTVRKGQIVVIDPSDARLMPLAAGPAPTRRFQITSQPIGARLTIDHSAEPTATQGVTPWVVELAQGQFANLKVEAEGCKPRAAPLTFEQAAEHVNLVLECEPKDARSDAGADTSSTSQPSPQPTPQPGQATGQERPVMSKPRKRSVTLRALPPQALLSVSAEGKQHEGVGTLTLSLDPQETLTVKATLAGHHPQEQTLRAAQAPAGGLTLTLQPLPMGCLTFRAEYPHENEYVLDGKSLGRSYGLKEHPVTAGRHTLVVRNSAVAREERFVLDVPAGKSCLSRSVWPRPE